MVTAHVDDNGIEQQLIDEILERFDGLRTDVATNIILTLLVKIFHQVYKNNFISADKALEDLLPQVKTALRMEFTLQNEDSGVNN